MCGYNILSITIAFGEDITIRRAAGRMYHNGNGVEVCSTGLEPLDGHGQGNDSGF
jgi:hypothetical protein